MITTNLAKLLTTLSPANWIQICMPKLTQKYSNGIRQYEALLQALTATYYCSGELKRERRGNYDVQRPWLRRRTRSLSQFGAKEVPGNLHWFCVQEPKPQNQWRQKSKNLSPRDPMSKASRKPMDFCSFCPEEARSLLHQILWMAMWSLHSRICCI